MLIRKLFKFENAHIVRNCSSDRCKRSIHGHSYKVEVLLQANRLDHGQMVYDFGLMKGIIKDLKFPSFSFENSSQGKVMLGISFVFIKTVFRLFE